MRACITPSASVSVSVFAEFAEPKADAFFEIKISENFRIEN